MIQDSELTWNYNQELDMFPKGPQKKKKDTIVVIVDGKTPQTIPTMDTPPEAPQKLPKCRLLVILTVVLILSLILLAGYCGWLFFSYEAAGSPGFVVSSEQQEEQDQQQHAGNHKQHTDGSPNNNPTVGPVLIEDALLHFSTSIPDIEKDSFSVNSFGGVSNSDSDFNFLSSGSSESVYDSSEPYGDSEATFSSSLSWGVEDPYYSDSWPASVEGTTKKSDGYLVTPPKKGGKGRFKPALEFLLKNFRNNGGVDATAQNGAANDGESSYWNGYEINGPISNDGSYFGNDLDWFVSSDFEEGSGFDVNDDVDEEDDVYSSMDSDWPIDLFSDVFSEPASDEGSPTSYEGSGFDVWYDSYGVIDGYIPRPVEPPRGMIDQSPPERIEIAVCNWPKKLFEKEAYNYGSVKMAQYPNPNYDVTSMSTSNVFITQIRSEVDGVLTARIFMRDYSVAIVAVSEMIKTPTSTISSCYFSFLTPGLQEDTFGDYYGRNDDEDEFEGSGGAQFGDDLQELTLEIRNPILLGSDLPIFSNPISKICTHSTKYWATSINIKQ